MKREINDVPNHRQTIKPIRAKEPKAQLSHCSKIRLLTRKMAGSALSAPLGSASGAGDRRRFAAAVLQHADITQILAQAVEVIRASRTILRLMSVALGVYSLDSNSSLFKPPAGAQGQDTAPVAERPTPLVPIAVGLSACGISVSLLLDLSIGSFIFGCKYAGQYILSQLFGLNGVCARSIATGR